VFDGRDTVTAHAEEYRHYSQYNARFPHADNGANEKLGGCLTATPENLLTRSVMHKKGKQNDYWERDS